MPKNWHYLAKTFSLKEKLISIFLIFVVIGTLLFWIVYIYISLTRPVPKIGGTYTEGVVGQPLYVNPLISQTSEADISLVRLIYSSLFIYDNQGNIQNDLADGYEISEDKKEYIINIKKGIKWHDNQDLTADDVVFTINILKDPAYKSPLRQTWQGVKVEKIEEHKVKFKLEEPYYGFLGNLTIGILPKHIWENIAPEKFTLADYNLEPIGSGPYSFSDYQKDSNGNILTYKLKAFKDYFKGQPYISNFNFNFYPDEDSVISAYKNKEVNGISSVSSQKKEQVDFGEGTNVFQIDIPRYFSVFLNQNNSVPLANDEVREALVFATDKKKILENVLYEEGRILNTPFLRNKFEEIENRDFNLNKAEEILNNAGWEKKDNGIRQKDGVKLKIELLTIDWPELSQTAQMLSEQWERVGMEVNVKVLSASDLQQNYIRPREYDALLFGQATNFNPDPYSFWHSSQKRDPGLNLSLFNNEDADKILEEARKEFNQEARMNKYKEFQEILSSQNPAIFLYTPYYLYPVNSKVKGVNLQAINSSAGRFNDVHKWYIKTKRIKK